MKWSFEIVKPTAQEWTTIESCHDSTIFHTQQWSKYLKRAKYPVIVVKVIHNETLYGYFIGSRIGIGRMSAVMAPSLGTGTYTQGLVTVTTISEEERVVIYQQLAEWLFKKGKAVYFHVDDWQLKRDHTEYTTEIEYHHNLLDKMGVGYTVRPTLYVNLQKSEEELWAGCSYKSCKYCVNKARKLGLRIRMIDKFEDIAEFTRIHYDHVLDVCEHKGMKPKASQERKRMQMLCEELFPNRVLMVEVLGNDDKGVEQIMSSGLFCYDQGESTYWTGGSYKRYQKYCPNELMVWEAMRILHERRAGDLNFGGMASYKLKFGTIYAYVPRITFVKYKWLNNIEGKLHRLYHKIHVRIGKLLTSFKKH